MSSEKPAFTPGPWRVEGSIYDHMEAEIVAKRGIAQVWKSHRSMADAFMIAAAPDMFEALKSVNKLIAEASLTGFNCHDGDWAERLYHSQQATSRALSKALGKDAP